MQRLRANFQSGTIQSLVGTALTFSSVPAFPSVTPGTNYIPLIINPTPYNGASTPEIVWVTTWAGGTTATVSRAQEGSSNTGTLGNGVVWAHGPTVVDFTLTSGMSEGTFPVASGTGYIFTSLSGAQNPYWSQYVPVSTLSGTFNNQVIVPATQVSGIQATQISGTFNNQIIVPATQVSGVQATQISGTFNSQIIVPVAQVSGWLPTTQISGTFNNQIIVPAIQVSGTFDSQVLMPATQVSGVFINAAIAGDRVTGLISGTQVSGTAFNIIISGTQIVGSQTAPVVGTISGSQIYGPLVNSTTISGSQLRGDIPAAQVSGTAFNIIISGMQIVSNINATQVGGGQVQQSVTISGQQINGSIVATSVSGNFGTNIGVQGSQVLGSLGSLASVSGSLIVGNNLPPTQISGTFNNQVVMPAAQVSGYLANATISGSQIANPPAADASDNGVNYSVTFTSTTSGVVPAVNPTGNFKQYVWRVDAQQAANASTTYVDVTASLRYRIVGAASYTVGDSANIGSAANPNDYRRLTGGGVLTLGSIDNYEFQVSFTTGSAGQTTTLNHIRLIVEGLN